MLLRKSRLKVKTYLYLPILKFLISHHDFFEVFPWDIADFESIFVGRSSLSLQFAVNTDLFLQFDEFFDMLDLLSS